MKFVISKFVIKRVDCNLVTFSNPNKRSSKFSITCFIKVYPKNSCAVCNRSHCFNDILKKSISLFAQKTRFFTKLRLFLTDNCNVWAAQKRRKIVFSINQPAFFILLPLSVVKVNNLNIICQYEKISSSIALITLPV